MSTKKGNKTRKPVTDDIRNKRGKTKRSSEYQTLKSGGKSYKSKSRQCQECEQYS